MSRFEKTSWSLVFLAGTDTPEARRALQNLCAAYHPPALAFIRSRGYRDDDARDLAQEFFATLLEKDWLRAADRTRGKFRSFLLTSLEHFLSNERARQRAQKRGSGIPNLPIEEAANVSGAPTPEQLYDRKWAMTVLECALERLRHDHEENGALERFEALKGCLTPSEPSDGYAAIAKRLRISEGAAKVASHRLRKAYGAAIRAEIADTLADGLDPDEELRHLMNALSAA